MIRWVWAVILLAHLAHGADQPDPEEALKKVEAFTKKDCDPKRFDLCKGFGDQLDLLARDMEAFAESDLTPPQNSEREYLRNYVSGRKTYWKTYVATGRKPDSNPKELVEWEIKMLDGYLSGLKNGKKENGRTGASQAWFQEKLRQALLDFAKDTSAYNRAWPRLMKLLKKEACLMTPVPEGPNVTGGGGRCPECHCRFDSGQAFSESVRRILPVVNRALFRDPEGKPPSRDLIRSSAHAADVLLKRREEGSRIGMLGFWFEADPGGAKAFAIKDSLRMALSRSLSAHYRVYQRPGNVPFDSIRRRDWDRQARVPGGDTQGLWGKDTLQYYVGAQIRASADSFSVDLYLINGQDGLLLGPIPAAYALPIAGGKPVEPFADWAERVMSSINDRLIVYFLFTVDFPSVWSGLEFNYYKADIRHVSTLDAKERLRLRGLAIAHRDTAIARLPRFRQGMEDYLSRNYNDPNNPYRFPFQTAYREDSAAATLILISSALSDDGRALRIRLSYMDSVLMQFSFDPPDSSVGFRDSAYAGIYMTLVSQLDGLLHPTSIAESLSPWTSLTSVFPAGIGQVVHARKLTPDHPWRSRLMGLGLMALQGACVGTTYYYDQEAIRSRSNHDLVAKYSFFGSGLALGLAGIISFRWDM